MLLYGGSGHAKVIRDCLQAAGEKVFFIFDDNIELTRLDDTPVIGPYKKDFDVHEELIISIGDNLTRKIVSGKVSHQFGKAIHPSAIISNYSQIDVGIVVMQGVIINAGSRIGKHVIVNTSSVVEHDCVLEDFVHVSPNATLCGNVKVGEGTQIGAAAVVIPNITIGKWCVIGAGSVIRENIPDYSMVIGVPGRIVKSLAKEV
jgi:sugar O-acyltransferase (sialic acid O-acetyltransferase NeuD family)